MTQDSTTPTPLTPPPMQLTSPQTPLTPPPATAVPEDPILADLESALDGLGDFSTLLEVTQEAEGRLAKLFHLQKVGHLVPFSVHELAKAVHVIHSLTSVRKTLIATTTALIKRRTTPPDPRPTPGPAPSRPISPSHPETPPSPDAPGPDAILSNNPGPHSEPSADIPNDPVPQSEPGVPSLAAPPLGGPEGANSNSPGWSSPERSEGERNPGLEEKRIGSPEGANLTGPTAQNSSPASVMGSPSGNNPESHRDGRNLPAPRPGFTPAPDADPDSSPHSALHTPHSDVSTRQNILPAYVRQARACPYLPGLTESELARLVFYIGSLQAWENRRQLWLRTPLRPPIWHPPAGGGFKLENTRPLSFPTKCFDPNFDPCRPATWSPEMIAAEYRREIPFFPSHELLGPIPPNPFSSEPQPAADTPSADPRPTAAPSTAHAWVGDASHEEDTPIEDDWDAEDAWPEGKTWDNYESWDDSPAEPPPIILWPPADDSPPPAASPDPHSCGPPRPG